MDPWIEEIVEQICIGIILRESTPDSTNRLSLITIDNAVEVGMKFYASYNNLVKDSLLDSPQGFFSALDKIKEIGKITTDQKDDIRQYHKIRNDLYHRAKLITVKEKSIDNYIQLAKELLENLYNFKMSDVEWKKMISDIRKTLTGKKIDLREPVTYESKEVKGTNLIHMKTPSKLQNTESIMLVIHGYIMNYAESPEKNELKKSLMISGRDISDSVLDSRLSDLKRTGFVERNELKLKGKALNRLRKKFLI